MYNLNPLTPMAFPYYLSLFTKFTPWPMIMSMERSSGGKLNQSSGSNACRSRALTIRTLQPLLAFLSSSVHFGTKKVTDTLGCLANCIANSRFMVDRPPLEDFHSSARRVTCNLLLDMFLETQFSIHCNFSVGVMAFTANE